MSDCSLFEVHRIRDGRLCAIFLVEVSIAVFMETARDNGYELKESRVYCETWKSVLSRSKTSSTRVKRCEPGDEGSINVVGCDFLKWKR